MIFSRVFSLSAVTSVVMPTADAKTADAKTDATTVAPTLTRNKILRSLPESAQQSPFILEGINLYQSPAAPKARRPHRATGTTGTRRQLSRNLVEEEEVDCSSCKASCCINCTEYPKSTCDTLLGVGLGVAVLLIIVAVIVRKRMKASARKHGLEKARLQGEKAKENASDRGKIQEQQAKQMELMNQMLQRQLQQQTAAAGAPPTAPPTAQPVQVGQAQ